MQRRRLILAVALGIGIAGPAILSTALAVPPGKTIVFSNSPMGIVTMDGKLHADKGLKCNACHPKLFAQKKGTAHIKITDHQEGKKFCFACHNSKGSAFPANNHCKKCHKNK